MAVKVLFKFGTQAQYDALSPKEEAALYWTLDTQRLYKGELLFAVGADASDVAAGLMSAEDKALLDALVSANPIQRIEDIEAVLPNKVDKALFSEEGRALIFNEIDGGGAKYEGTNGYDSFVGVNSDTETGIGAQLYDINRTTNTGSKLDVTANGIFYTTGEASAQSAVLRDVEANEIATKKDIQSISVPEYSLRKETDPGAYAAIYHLTKDGVDVGEAINIAKDQLLKSVEVKTCTEKDVPIEGLNVGDKYLDFTFIVEGGVESHSYIAIKDMVKPYSAGEGIIITSDNAITYDPEVLSTVEYVDANISDTMNFIIQERDAEHAGRVAGDNLLDARIKKLEMPNAPYFDTALNVLFLNGVSARITDNGTTNLLSWFSSESEAGAPNTMSFPKGIKVMCGGDGREKAVEFSGG